MEKRVFFDKLNLELSVKHNLTDRQINTIRSWFLGYKKSRKEIAEWCAFKLSQPHVSHGLKANRRRHKKEHYQELLNFIASCSTEAWNDITQITKFDNGIADTTADVS